MMNGPAATGPKSGVIHSHMTDATSGDDCPHWLDELDSKTISDRPCSTGSCELLSSDYSHEVAYDE